MPGEVQLLLVGHRRLSIKELVSLGPPLEVEVDHWNTCVLFVFACVVCVFLQLSVDRATIGGPMKRRQPVGGKNRNNASLQVSGRLDEGPSE